MEAGTVGRVLPVQKWPPSPETLVSGSRKEPFGARSPAVCDTGRVSQRGGSPHPQGSRFTSYLVDLLTAHGGQSRWTRSRQRRAGGHHPGQGCRPSFPKTSVHTSTGGCGAGLDGGHWQWPLRELRVRPKQQWGPRGRSLPQTGGTGRSHHVGRRGNRALSREMAPRAKAHPAGDVRTSDCLTRLFSLQLKRSWSGHQLNNN